MAYLWMMKNRLGIDIPNKEGYQNDQKHWGKALPWKFPAASVFEKIGKIAGYDNLTGYNNSLDFNIWHDSHHLSWQAFDI